MKKNILLICYYFPPLAGVAGKRSVEFSKYLKKYGWHPYVVSVKNPDKAYCSIGNDKPPDGLHLEYSCSFIKPYKFLGKINGAIFRLFRLFNITVGRNYLYDIFCFPDHFFGWIPHTTFKCMKLIRKFRIDVIFATCSPFSSAAIGVLLKAITGKPLVIDFQDPFAIIVPEYLGVPKLRKRINLHIENFFLKHSNALIVTSEETRNAYAQQYPEKIDKIFTVHGGFESECLSEKAREKYKIFTIIYAGHFYTHFPQLEIYTDMFFRAIGKLKGQQTICKDNFQFLYFGVGKYDIERIAAEYGVQDLVRANFQIPRHKVLKAISKSHLQLLRIVKPMISTKLFEGIALNVPLLAIIPSGEVEKIIKKYSPSSYIITSFEVKKIIDAILDAISKYEKGGVPDNHVQEFFEKFSREKLSVKLIEILEKVAGHQGNL